MLAIVPKPEYVDRFDGTLGVMLKFPSAQRKLLAVVVSEFMRVGLDYALKRYVDEDCEHFFDIVDIPESAVEASK
jgi:hypothetical protein